MTLDPERERRQRRGRTSRKNHRRRISGSLQSEIKISKTKQKTTKPRVLPVSSHADRGRDAERVFEKAYRNGAKIQRASRGHDFVLEFPNGQNWYVDVKRVEKSVSSGGVREEPGRVQIEKSELDYWLDIDRKENFTSWLVVAVKEGNRFKWRRVKARDVVPMVRGKQDPYKLTMKQIESMENFSPYQKASEEK